MATIALCEDNSFQREMMEELLSEYSSTNHSVSVTAFETSWELLEHVKKNGGFDIYILDIVMPGINGMELASTLRMMKDEGSIIFTTASMEYAVASYDVKAFYYMVKPIDSHRLFHILDEVFLKLKPHESTVTVRTKDGDVDLRLKDILYVEVIDRAMKFYLSNGKTCKSIALRGSFREAITELANQPNFAFCGVSKLINLKFVDNIDSETVLLKDGTILYPPRSVYAELRRQWRDFIR